MGWIRDYLWVVWMESQLHCLLAFSVLESWTISLCFSLPASVVLVNAEPSSVFQFLSWVRREAPPGWLLSKGLLDLLPRMKTTRSELFIFSLFLPFWSHLRFLCRKERSGDGFSGDPPIYTTRILTKRRRLRNMHLPRQRLRLRWLLLKLLSLLLKRLWRLLAYLLGLPITLDITMLRLLFRPLLGDTWYANEVL